MDCKINWTNKAWQTFNENIAYLQSAWTSKEISNFVLQVDNRLANLAKHPEIGSPRNKKTETYDLLLYTKEFYCCTNTSLLKKKLIY